MRRARRPRCYTRDTRYLKTCCGVMRDALNAQKLPPRRRGVVVGGGVTCVRPVLVVDEHRALLLRLRTLHASCACAGAVSRSPRVPLERAQVLGCEERCAAPSLTLLACARLDSSARATRLHAQRRDSRESLGLDIGAPLELQADTFSDSATTPEEASSARGMPDKLAAALQDKAGAALAHAVLVYGDLSNEALAYGIPRHALPVLPTPLKTEQVRAATDLLQRIIASRLSSNL